MNRYPVAFAALALALLPIGAGIRAADPDPTIATVLPASGPTVGGTAVTITGTGFVAPMEVSFGGTPAPGVTVVSPTEIQVLTPPHARGAVDVIVTRTAPPPPASSAPAVAAYAYVAPPARIWVPRAPGSATGGNPGGKDLCVVDAANRVLEASLDLNAADPLLPTDTDWKVTQVLFHPSGAWAFCATAGKPGTLDSRRIFVLKTARALGQEEGDPVVASLDTGGNPYQLALSQDGRTLFVADGGSWKGSSTILPDGKFRAYDVTDPAAPAERTGSPATVGILPVLAWDSAAYRRWGTNSSFPGLAQSSNNRCVVTNAGSHTLSVVDLTTLGIVDTEDAGVPEGGILQLTVSLPSPYSGDFVFVETTDLASGKTAYFLYRISTGALESQGIVSLPMTFFQVIVAPSVSLELQGRQAWPHPDGVSLVAVPASGANVVTWNPASGSAGAKAAIPGTDPPASLAFNDTTGLLYARRKTGGWTVLSVPDARGAAPQVVAQVEDATGVNSLRVFGNGAELAGTATSTLALVDGNPASPTAHQVVATVALPLDPAGGAVHPQPSPAGAPARVFVTLPGPGSGPRIQVPLEGTEFAAGDPPPGFEFLSSAEGPARHEIEIGTQPDFLTGPGAGRIVVRVPAGTETGTPSRGAWRRVLRAAAGNGVQPLYARVNAVLPSGARIYGDLATYGVRAPVAPSSLAPDGGSVSKDAPPTFTFQTPGPGRAWIQVLADPAGPVLAQWPVRGAQDGGSASFTPRTAAWREAVRRAVHQAPSAAPEILGTIGWRVRFQDALGQDVSSEVVWLSIDALQGL